MSNVEQLPDLARMRALSERVRAATDEQVSDMLATEDGAWLFVECAPYLDDDVARRLVKSVTAGIPDGAFFALLGLKPGRR